MIITIEVTKENTKNLLRSLSSKVRDLRPPLQGFANYMGVETEQQFKDEKDPEGRPWARLAPSTALEKKEKGYPSDILTRSGKMRRSVVTVYDTRSFLMGVDVDYARWHQEGTRRMPQRKILGLNSDRRAKLGKLIRVYVGSRK